MHKYITFFAGVLLGTVHTGCGAAQAGARSRAQCRTATSKMPHQRLEVHRETTVPTIMLVPVSLLRHLAIRSLATNRNYYLSSPGLHCPATHDHLVGLPLQRGYRNAQRENATGQRYWTGRNSNRYWTVPSSGPPARAAGVTNPCDLLNTPPAAPLRHNLMYSIPLRILDTISKI